MGVSCISFGSILVLVWNSQKSFLINNYELEIVTFTIFQAFCSAFVSVFLAIPVSKAIYRNNFPGKAILVTLMNIIFVLPVLIIILTVIKVFGFNGIPNQILDLVGIEKISIYGLQGILVGHVLINLPFAVRLMLSGWLMIPQEHFRLARQLNFRKAEYFRYLELPMLRKIIPGIFTIIFLFCCLTFSIALILGGGPGATTIELAIYQSIIFEGNVGIAARLSIYQLILMGLILLISFKISGKPVFENAIILKAKTFMPKNKLDYKLDIIWISLFSLFISLPIIIIFYKGIANILSVEIFLFYGLFNSLFVALLAAVVNLSISVVLCFTIIKEESFKKLIIEIGSFSLICISPLVLGTAIFLVLFEHIDIADNALVLTGLANGILMIPISLTILLPGFIKITDRYGHIMRSLGLSNIKQILEIYFPLLSSNIRFSFALVFVLSIGDLGIIVLFSGSESSTLPMYLYRLMGSYRMDEAYTVGLVLVTLALSSFWFIEKGFYYGTLRKKLFN